MADRGFTLIEVLVALALTALVAILAYGALSSSLTAAETAASAANRLQALEQTFNLLQRDLGQIVKRPISNNFGEREAAFSAGQTPIALLTLTRGGWANSRQQQRSELQRVDYRWQDGHLWRDYWFNADRGPLDEPESALLLNNVSSIHLRLLDMSADSTGLEGGQWRDTWLAQQSGDRLPAAIEVVLKLEYWGDVRRVFVLPDNDL